MLPAVSMSVVRSSGSILIVLSAVAFGAMAVFGRLAYADGATVGTLLSARFLLAAAVSWAMLLGTRAGMAELRALSRRDGVLALGLVACGYAAQAGGYFIALTRIDASLLALLVSTYPAIVGAAAVFFAGLRRVGPTSAAIVSTVEPLVTVLLALIVFGEVLGPVQVLGGALVVGAVLVLNVRLARPAPAPV